MGSVGAAPPGAPQWTTERRLVETRWLDPARPKREAQRMAGVLTVADYAATWIAERQLKARTRMGYESILERRATGSPLGAVAP